MQEALGKRQQWDMPKMERLSGSGCTSFSRGQEKDVPSQEGLVIGYD